MPNDAARIKDFRLFVIGRNSAHFSGPSNPDPRAAWGIWYQLVYLVENAIKQPNPLASIFTSMVKESPLKKDLIEAGGEEFSIGDKKIILESIRK